MSEIQLQSSVKPEQSLGQSSDTQSVECRIFTSHYDQLANLLLQTNLTPYLVKEEVILTLDEEELSSISTSTRRAQFVLQKISASLKCGFNQSFYKLLNIMKSHGNNDLKQLAAMMDVKIAQSSVPSDTDDSQVKLKPAHSAVSKQSVEFGTLLSEIQDILENSSTLNLDKLKAICFSLTSTENSLMFSSQDVARIKACTSVHGMFYELRDHWRYDDHPLLYAIVKQSGSAEAMQKLKLFKNKIKYHRKLTELYDKSQTSQTPLPDGYTRMVAIVEKDYDKITLAECEEIKEMLYRYFGDPAPRPPTYEPSDSITITWYIPIEAVGRVLDKVYQATKDFTELSISFFEVHGIIIWNKKWPCSLKGLWQDNRSQAEALSHKEQKINSLKAAVKELESDNKQLQEQVQSYIQESEDEKTQHAKKFEELLKEIEELKEENQELKKASKIGSRALSDPVSTYKTAAPKIMLHIRYEDMWPHYT